MDVRDQVCVGDISYLTLDLDWILLFVGYTFVQRG